MESGEHAEPLRAHKVTQAHELASVHAIFLCALTKLCQISKIKVYIESQDYFPYVWTYSRTCEGARGLYRRLKATHRGQRPPNSPPQELEKGVP